MAKATASDTRSLEEIQREILEVELETKKLNLAEAKQRNAEFVQREEMRRKHNRQRMSELKAGRDAAEAVVRECRHKSGGNPTNILRGGGIGSFSILTRALMPDGVTRLIQCSRCRLKVYFRLLTAPEEAKLQKGDPDKFAHYLEGKRLFEISKDQGLEHAELRGPTFFFQNEQGVPIIPEIQ
jgi:hypothetical protein